MVEKRRENAAKAFLMRYRAMMQRRESLQRSIDEAYERATSCTAKIKAVNVQSSGSGDRMVEDVIKGIDGAERLKAVIRQIDHDLGEILTAIDSVPNEMQKTVLTLRYIEGLDWIRIQENLHFERTQTLVVHGRGLWHVKQWMEKERTKTD